VILSLSVTSLTAWLAHLPAHTRVILALAFAVFIVEVLLRWLAPRSRVYAGWKRCFEAVGHVWTLVILSVVYVIGVGPVRLSMLLAGKDPLDRAIGAETSAWRPHTPNPLGPEAAARHQF
jgi:hypothetical protein